MKYFLISCVLLHGCLLAFATSVFAEPACPDWANPDASIMERSFTYISNRTGQPRGVGPRFDTLAYTWTMGTWFKLPYGYINPWPDPKTGDVLLDKQAYIKLLSKYSSTTGFDPGTQNYNASLVTKKSLRGDFAFWYPSLRYVERNTMFLASYRPCEAGRNKPSLDEFVVRFWLEWPFLPDSGVSAAARIFRRQKERLKLGKPLPFSNMERTEHAYYEPVSGYKPYAIYHDDRDLAVVLSCHAIDGEEAPVNPLCRGDVWHKPSDLIFFIIFPSEAGQLGNEVKWMGPVNAVISLARQWRAAAENDQQAGPAK